MHENPLEVPIYTHNTTDYEVVYHNGF